MDKYIVGFLCIQTLLLITIVAILLRKQKSYDDFSLCQQVLLNIIEFYTTHILLPKIYNLRKKFDLDSESKSKAVKRYTEEYSELVSESAKEIIKKYLSIKTRQTLLQYYSLDGLILFIISNLRRVS